MATSKPINSTYDHASELLKPYVQPLWPGAHAQPFSIRDQDGRPLGLYDDSISGRPLLIVLLNHPESTDELIQILSNESPRLASLNIPVLMISADSNASRNSALRSRFAFQWPVLGDSTGAVFAGFGLH